MSARASRMAPWVAAAACCAALAGCATTGEKQVYVDWLRIRNPEAVCNGEPDCLRRSTYAGKPRCTIVTGDHEVSYERLGARVRECFDGAG